MPPSTLHRTAAAGGLAAALIAGESLTLAGVAGAVTPDTWAKLRACESSGNYSVNTGNGYYGAYQFNVSTWRGLGYPGLPSEATPAVQDGAAQRLYDARGWQPWPACSVKLGLVDDRAASRGTERVPLAPVVVPPVVVPPVAVPPPAVVDAAAPAAPTASAAPAAAAPAAAPAPVAVPVVAVTGNWNGHYLTTHDVGRARADVSAWQQKMVGAGYSLTVDGRYGPQSAAATTRFETAKGLEVENPGIVGPQVWSALFS